ncbi:MAG TPA: amylo-alpha-1,6-glucosidase, partial [Ktedonobacterales bacterium]|nr:amylo-alpha-1,6-glucosidase [Ktedonobacterales bacterium]
RTLASSSYAFDPLSYHRGSIWPFDNALFAAALWRMGRRESARMLGRRILDAFGRFGTPVELYCALSAGWVRAPDLGDVEALVVYQPACLVQAWSAAAMLLFGAQLLVGEEPAG